MPPVCDPTTKQITAALSVNTVSTLQTTQLVSQHVPDASLLLSLGWCRRCTRPSRRRPVPLRFNSNDGAVDTLPPAQPSRRLCNFVLVTKSLSRDLVLRQQQLQSA